MERYCNLGYPETALNTAANNFNIHLRTQKGYIQRVVSAGEIQSIQPHPKCFELSFPVARGMSGAPLFAANGADRQDLIGICVGSYRSEIVDYLSKEIVDDGRVSQEKHLRVEEVGIAESVLPLLSWSPTILDGRTLESCIEPSYNRS